MIAMKIGVVTLLISRASRIQPLYTGPSSVGAAAPPTTRMAPSAPNPRITAGDRCRQSAIAASATNAPPTSNPNLRSSRRLVPCRGSRCVIVRDGESFSRGAATGRERTSIELELALPCERVLGPSGLLRLGQDVRAEHEVVDVCAHEAAICVFRRA